MTRLDRSEAGREILSATERLSDGLAVAEQDAFGRIAEALRAECEQLTGRVQETMVRHGKVQVWLRVDDLLPAREDLEATIMPVVGDLLALTRERTLVVVRRNMKASGQAIALTWVHLPARGVSAAKSLAPALETEWFDKAAADFARAYLDSRTRMRDQVERWYGRDETIDQLVLRLTSENVVTLPGSETRGALWSMRPWMNLAARNASVALTNGLLLAAMGGWNDAASGQVGA